MWHFKHEPRIELTQMHNHNDREELSVTLTIEQNKIINLSFNEYFKGKVYGLHTGTREMKKKSHRKKSTEWNGPCCRVTHNFVVK